MIKEPNPPTAPVKIDTTGKLNYNHEYDAIKIQVVEEDKYENYTETSKTVDVLQILGDLHGKCVHITIEEIKEE